MRKNRELENWRTGELENWRTGELENWRTGELENWRTKVAPLKLSGQLSFSRRAKPDLAFQQRSDPAFPKGAARSISEALPFQKQKGGRSLLYQIR
ncbi:hypothetical protein VITU9109_01072 [Vibrio tubiashii ATCC 19109]|uniref:Uncharacterized protein n=1 Tax=Vibrio tubiashii ATCC 19109 TaxID=1051646 RepID=A0ABN0DCT5_9VIBR|nr:hypothetical protein VITU9109_01072 [Vibrio tubiashii ATCC 19109]